MLYNISSSQLVQSAAKSIDVSQEQFFQPLSVLSGCFGLEYLLFDLLPEFVLCLGWQWLWLDFGCHIWTLQVGCLSQHHNGHLHYQFHCSHNHTCSQMNCLICCICHQHSNTCMVIMMFHSIQTCRKQHVLCLLVWAEKYLPLLNCWCNVNELTMPWWDVIVGCHDCWSCGSWLLFQFCLSCSLADDFVYFEVDGHVQFDHVVQTK